MMRVLAIDQGTTSTRAVVVDEDGTSKVLASLEHRQIYPRKGWVEHDPEELLRNVVACIEAAPAGTDCVGIDNQGESCLAWDRKSLAPLCPVIVWQDERTADRTGRLRAEGAEALTLSRAGLPLDPYFSASKLAWILENVPEARDLAASGRLCLGTTDAYFRHRLTDRFETDVATASRTSLMNLATCAWDQDLCALFGVPLDCLPAITPTSGALGEIAPHGLPLAASIVDQQAALRGHGCRDRGDTKITFGTGAFVLAVAGEDIPPADTGPLPTVAWSRPDGRPFYALDGGVYAAAAAVNWARSLGLFSNWSEIGQFEGPPAIAKGLAFVPALTGLACPHWDRHARGSWMGMGLDTVPLDLVRAVLEGVAFRTAEVVRAMDKVIPVSGSISIDGGMTRNRWFCQFLADCLGREIRISDEPELTAIGTARIAAEVRGSEIAQASSSAIVTPKNQPPSWSERFKSARHHAQGFGRETGD